MKSVKRKPHSTSLILLLACIFAFWWGISILTKPQPAQPPAAVTQAKPLVVHVTLSGTTQTYSGVFSPPACDSFGSGIRYSAANGGHVTVLLITEPASAACAQAAGNSPDEPFSVSVKVSRGSAPIFDGVLLNGSNIPAQLAVGN
jgi:hypothetical protein